MLANTPKQFIAVRVRSNTNKGEMVRKNSKNAVQFRNDIAGRGLRPLMQKNSQPLHPEAVWPHLPFAKQRRE
jgi:hypothetical protein